jgi:hypothetical protein
MNPSPSSVLLLLVLMADYFGVEVTVAIQFSGAGNL